jgi:quinol monooxygenase YgiN
MKKIMVRYQVKEERVAENEELVKEVYRQLHEEKPAGLRYSTYRLADGVSFVHVASYETETAHTTLVNLAAFKNFQANIKERCKKIPEVEEVTEIGSYHFLENNMEALKDASL